MKLKYIFVTIKFLKIMILNINNNCYAYEFLKDAK